MTTLTAYGIAGDGHANSQNVTYSTARAGSSLTSSTTLIYVGQVSGYNCLEGFIAFDTSSIPDDATITQVELSLYLVSDGSDTDFTVQVHPKTWTPSGLTTADYVPGADIAALTLLASLSSSGIGATGAHKTFTENGSNFRNAINKTGNTELLLASSRHSSGNVPTGNEYLWFASEASYAGTATDPKLVVTYTVSVTHEAAAALAAAVTLAPKAGLLFAPGASLAAAATLSPLATGEVLADTALAATGALAADGNLGVIFAASALVGSATLAALAAPLVKNAAATLSASALLTASATRIAPIKTVSLGAGSTSASRQHGGVAT